MRSVHAIESESYRRLRNLVDLSCLPPLSRAVTERVIHASADLTYADDLVCDEGALERGFAALRSGAPIFADVRMVAAGITARPALCVLDMATEDVAPTRCAAAVRGAVRDHKAGAIWVIGCAPTALEELLASGAEPALVVGLPVGFVGAAEQKAALRASGLPALSNRSSKGGSAVAAAAINALIYIEKDADD